MFTVKFCTETFDRIYSAERVEFRANNPCDSWVSLYDCAGNNVATVSGGTVYVMNDSGATVAKYDTRAVDDEHEQV